MLASASLRGGQGNTIVVKNISFATTDADLSNLFSPVRVVPLPPPLLADLRIGVRREVGARYAKEVTEARRPSAVHGIWVCGVREPRRGNEGDQIVRADAGGGAARAS